MRIGLIYNNNCRKDRGTFKVVDNLIKGLDIIGADYGVGERGDVTGVIQGWGDIWNGQQNLPNVVFGPNCVVLPEHAPWAFREGMSHVVPCEWVKAQYQLNPECKAKLYVWPVGIDTDEIRPMKNAPEFDCLIYYKDVTRQRSDDDIKLAIKELVKRGQSFRLIRYGSYNQNDYLDLLSKCRYQLILAGTESQFISLLESFCLNKPSYVLDVNEMIYDGKSYTGQGYTTVPYFDDRCGAKCQDYRCFDHFLQDLPFYSPRDYVLNNLTLDRCAQRYVDIMKEVYNG